MEITLEHAYGNSLFYVVGDIADMIYDIMHFDRFRSKCIDSWDIQFLRKNGISVKIDGKVLIGARVEK